MGLKEGQNKCENCAHGKEVKAKETGTMLGFLRCPFDKAYHWWPPQHRCHVGRHEPRTDQPEGAQEGQGDGGGHREASAAIWGDGEQG